MAKGKDKSGRLSVFKGREARLNRAVFHILAHRGPQIIYHIYKELKVQKGLRHVRYASVNKRVRFLEETGYIMKIGTKRTKAGFEASLYDLGAKGFLAILLNIINLDGLLTRLDESTASTILAEIAKTIQP